MDLMVHTLDTAAGGQATALLGFHAHFGTGGEMLEIWNEAALSLLSMGMRIRIRVCLPYGVGLLGLCLSRVKNRILQSFFRLLCAC